jgi:hemerythrin superfamily protein
VEQLAAAAQKSGDLTEFKDVFDYWVKQLMYHASVEDEYMTAPLSDSPPARDNETEHAQLAQQGGQIVEYLGRGDGAEFEDRVRRVMLSLEDQQHHDIMERLEEIQRVLAKEVGQNCITARTRRHLYRQVLELRCLEYDHFENEEAFVMPLVRQEFSESEQLGLVRKLLFQEGVNDPRWIIDWVRQELSPTEARLLDELESQLVASGAR